MQNYRGKCKDWTSAAGFCGFFAFFVLIFAVFVVRRRRIDILCGDGEKETLKELALFFSCLVTAIEI